MRLVEQLPATEEPFRLTQSRRDMLEHWLKDELQDAFSARHSLESAMIENMRQYEGRPRIDFKTVPYEGASNIEFNISGIAVDTIYAQSLDLIFSMNPVATVRATNAEFIDYERPVQRFIDWGVGNEWKLRPAAEHAILDDIKHGTGIYFIPYIERVKTTDISRITMRGPRIFALPLEDFITPGGAGDIERANWVGMRQWLNPNELEMRSQIRGWNIDHAQATSRTSRILTTRNSFGRTRTATTDRSGMFEAVAVYANVDIDSNGVERDMLIYVDRTSGSVMKAVPMPFDYWPFESMRYQIREHMFQGIGVPEMSRTYQEGITEMMNNWLDNSFLANMRGFKGPHGAIPGDRIVMRPGKYYPFAQPDLVEIFALADTYPSAPAAVQTLMAFAQQRSGVNEATSPSGGMGSNRTPATTALSLMQQANKRFVPAFDGMRLGTSAAVTQCLYRYQERLLAGDTDVEEHLTRVLGSEDGSKVIEVLKDAGFDEALKLELTASSATVNRLQERQDAITMAGLVGQYYDKVVELMGMASQEGLSEPMREVALKVANATGEIIKRTVQTFDQIRDPERFIIELEDEISAIPGVPATGIEGILGMLGGAGGQAPPGNGTGLN